MGSSWPKDPRRAGGGRSQVEPCSKRIALLCGVPEMPDVQPAKRKRGTMATVVGEALVEEIAPEPPDIEVVHHDAPPVAKGSLRGILAIVRIAVVQLTL